MAASKPPGVQPSEWGGDGLNTLLAHTLPTALGLGSGRSFGMSSTRLSEHC